MGNNTAQAISWFETLSENEQDILIELLYNLDLQEYVNMDKFGNVLSLKNEI